MSLKSLDLYVLLGELQYNAFNELDDIADYIYKVPRLLTHEKVLEQRKMATYFPDGGITADIRERIESRKLNETFPRLIAVANLFLAMSVFENYVLLLLKILQEHNTTMPKHDAGKGVAAYLKATKVYGAEPYDAMYYEQVCAAISIRNCLMHAKGLLSAFSKAGALKTQVSQHKFLCSDNRRRRAERGPTSSGDVVTIEDSELGDQLVITNDYSHLVCFYLREYFCALCGTLNPIIALRPLVYKVDPGDLTF